MNESSERKENHQPSKIFQLDYILLVIAPVLYVLILIILQSIVLDEMVVPDNLFENTFLNFLLFVFILLSVGNILFTYLFIIPLARKEDDIKARASKNLVMLACGGDLIAVYGLILGILWWREYDFVPFLIIIPFFAASMIHRLYLYFKYIL